MQLIPRVPYSVVLRIKGMYDAAIREMVVHLERTRDSEAIGIIRQAYGAGDFDAAMLAYAQLLESRSAQQYVEPMDVAMPYAYAGEREKAFEWIEIAYRERSYAMVYLNVLPFPDELRSDPRFGEFLDRMKIPH